MLFRLKTESTTAASPAREARKPSPPQTGPA
jgi:hypothetical protein